jgi:hypothetical protein
MNGTCGGTHIIYQVGTASRAGSPSFTSYTPWYLNFYFGIFSRALSSSKVRFGTLIQTRLSGDGTGGKQNTPGCLNQTRITGQEQGNISGETGDR